MFATLAQYDCSLRDRVSYFTDIDILQQQLDPRLFPGVGGGPWVHEGFLEKHDEFVLFRAMNIIK